MTIEEIKREQNGLTDLFEKDKTMYDIEQAENDLVRSPYEVELKWLGALENGEEVNMSEEGKHVEQCKDYIAKHLYQQFTIQQMAKEMSVSRSYLSSIFSKQTGMSMKEYVIEQRLIAASNMLKYSGELLFKISEYMKFSSQSSFSMFLKRNMELLC